MRSRRIMTGAALWFIAIRIAFPQTDSDASIRQALAGFYRLQEVDGASRITLDFNGNSIFEDTEMLPAPIDSNGAVQWETILGIIVQSKERLAKRTLVKLGTDLSPFVVPEPGKVDERFGELFSYLSLKGIHPFKAGNIYYLPDGSGEVAYKPDRVVFFDDGALQYVEDKNRDRTIAVVTLPDGRKAPASDAGFFQGTGRLQCSQLREFTRFLLPGGEEAWCNYIEFFKSGAIRYANPAGEKAMLPNGIMLVKPVNIEFYESGSIRLANVDSGYRIDLPIPAGTILTVSDWAKVLVNTTTAGAKTKLAFKVDTVAEGFAGKIEFSEGGKLIGLGIWEKPQFDPPMK